MQKFSLKKLAFLFNQILNFDVQVKGFCVDTRSLGPSHVFIALPGNRTNGHQFLAQAASCGAVAAIVQDAYRGPDYNLPLIKVPDTLQALQLLAQWKIRESKAKIIAVTGSVGKTTTKDFLTTLLEKKLKITSSPGNANSQVGMPLAILNHTKGDEDGIILEMGLSEEGQIAKLVNIAPPDIAILTTAALVHAFNFESLEHIAAAKAEIFSHPQTSLGILDASLPNFAAICQKSPCYKLSFSTASDAADFYLEEINDRMRISGKRFSEIELSSIKLPGKHNKHNFLAAAIAARHMGLTWAEIEENAKGLKLPEKRCEILEKKGILFVNDSYNAAEVSMKAALESLPLPKFKGRRIAVIGEMLELGQFSDGCHQSVGQHALKYVDELICFGELCRPMSEIWAKKGRPVFLSSNWEEIVDYTKKTLKENDVVLLKGSRSKEMWKILDEY